MRRKNRVPLGSGGASPCVSKSSPTRCATYSGCIRGSRQSPVRIGPSGSFAESAWRPFRPRSGCPLSRVSDPAERSLPPTPIRPQVAHYPACPELVRQDSTPMWKQSGARDSHGNATFSGEAARSSAALRTTTAAICVVQSRIDTRPRAAREPRAANCTADPVRAAWPTIGDQRTRRSANATIGNVGLRVDALVAAATVRNIALEVTASGLAHRHRMDRR